MSIIDHSSGLKFPEVPEHLKLFMEQQDRLQRQYVALVAESEKISKAFVAQMQATEIAEHFRRSLWPAIKMAQDYQKAFSQLDLASIQLEEQFHQVMHVATEFEKTNRNLFHNISEAISRVGEVADAFGAMMVELGWPPVGDLTPRHMQEVVESYQKNGLEAIRTEVDAFMLEFYDEQVLRKKLAEWESKEWFAHRLPILRDAVEAHLGGKYWLSVPAILPQIEGIIVDGYGFHGRMKQRAWEDRFNRLFSNPNGLEKGIKEYVLVKVLLVGFDHGSPVGSPLSRHAILHGGDTEYGTQMNSLKAILLFDFLQRSFRWASLPGDNRYHRIGCEVILASDVERTVYCHRSEALAAELEPCELCQPDKF